jgi:hypothetical protein
MPGTFFNTLAILPIHYTFAYLIGHAIRSVSGMQRSSQSGTVVCSDEGNSGRLSAGQLLLKTSALVVSRLSPLKLALSKYWLVLLPGTGFIFPSTQSSGV